jgi:hypothetical protein
MGKAGLDARDLCFREDRLLCCPGPEFRHTAERCECSGMSGDPVGQCLGPARLGVGETS